MVDFWGRVNKVIKNADIILEVLDARMIGKTRNPEIERKIEKYGKRIIYVINKCDLADRKTIDQAHKELQPSVFVSSTQRLGTTLLKKKILEISRGEPTVVGVVGYPNVGKSSVINGISGRKSARTSCSSGFTHGIQKVKVSDKITLLDTPGVFPDKEKNEEKHAFTGAIDYSKVKEPAMVVLRLITENTLDICQYYGVQEKEDPEEILEEIGIKANKLLPGGIVDEDTVSRMILKDWQTGKIKKK